LLESRKTKSLLVKTHALQKNIGPAEFKNPDEYLCSIRQTGMVQEYHKEFAKRSAQVSHWPNNRLLGVFLSGLKDEFKAYVRIRKPRTIYDAMSLALELESKMGHNRSGKSSDGNQNTSFTYHQEPYNPKSGVILQSPVFLESLRSHNMMTCGTPLKLEG